MSAERVNELIRAAGALPDHLRDWLIDGFTAWQAGGDLEAALHLDAAMMDLQERDALIAAAVSGCPGESEAARISAFLTAMRAGPSMSMRRRLDSS